MELQSGPGTIGHQATKRGDARLMTKENEKEDAGSKDRGGCQITHSKGQRYNFGPQSACAR